MKPFPNSLLRHATPRWIAWALMFLTVLSACAHYCGPPVIRCKPGDVITYYIISDMAEVGDSLYSVFDESDPEVAPLVFYTPIARIAGVFMFVAQEVGINDVDLFWAFPPNGFSDFCVLRIIVQEETSTTSGNNPFSAFSGDPVNMFNGELVLREPPDLNLGGPMPLAFSRYYASRLIEDATVNSRLGDNWSHNFDWRAIRVITNQAFVISPEGLRVRFARSGDDWVLQSPTEFPFQLVNSGDDIVFGDPRYKRLYTFDTNGLLTAISDGKGNAHTLAYTGDFLLSQVSDGLGRALNFTYAGARFLAAVSDGTRTIQFQQQTVGGHGGTRFLLTGARNALGKLTAYSYDSSSDISALLTDVTYPAGNAGYAQVYDAAGRVIEQTRLGTNITRFAYNTNSFTTWLTNAQGDVHSFVHSPNGRLLSITDAAGQTLTVSTNAQGRRAAMGDRAGGNLGIVYDAASGLPSVITNADGTVTRFTYTNRAVNGITFHALGSVILPDGAAQQFTYDAVGNLRGHRDAAGRFTRFAYNSRGQITALTNAAGGVVTFAYNPDGTLAGRTDSETGTISYLYDALRRPTNAVAADGGSISTAFDAGDRLLSITDERMNRSAYGYDDNDRVTAVTNALGQVMRFTYDTADRITGITDALGRQTGFAYDALDQLTAMTNRHGNVVTLGWDDRQRFTSLTDPGGRTWTTGYDDEGVATSFTDPIGNTIRQALDSVGFVSAITNAAGEPALFGRDAMHRVTATVDALGRIHQLEYDSRGLLTNTTFSAVGAAAYEMNELGLLARLTDQTGRAWEFNHTALGRLQSIVDPLNRTTSIAYDVRGRPWRFAFPDGSSQTNSYDAAGNLVRLDFSDGLTVPLEHDALNRPTNTTALALAYDAEGRITNTVSSGINFSAAYDGAGRLTNAAYNNGAFSVSYTYDSADRLTQVRDSLTGALITFFYDDAGKLTNVMRANGVHGLYSYDAAGRITRIREGGFIDLQFTLNAAGEAASLTATTPLALAPGAALINDLMFDAGHQISSAGYTYDARGRLIASPGHTFSWNGASKLTRVDSVTNTYNGAGSLLTRATAGGTTRYHYNHALVRAPIVAEQNGGSEFERFYVWSPDGRLLYMIDAADGNAVSYFHFDQVGSTLALTSAAGAVTDAYSYSPYGVVLARTGDNPQPFTYVGEFGVRSEAAANLYQMGVRYYDPATARFLSRDPLWPRPADALNLNPYSYAANNPLRYIDPEGGDPQSRQNELAALYLLGNPAIIATITASRMLAFVAGNEFLPGGSSPAGAALRLSALGVALHGADLARGPLGPLLARQQQDVVMGIRFTLLTQPNLLLSPFALSPGAQIGLMHLQSEMAVVTTYGAMLNVMNRWGTPHSLGALGVSAFTGIHPDDLEPLGLAFVNGQIVRPKLKDVLDALDWRDDLYDYLWEEDYTPRELMWEMFGPMLGWPGGWNGRVNLIETR